MNENYNLCLKELLNEKPIVVSQMLLKHYADIDMDETELVVVLQLLRFKECSGQTYPSVDELQKSMTLSSEQIKATLAHLIEKGLISVVHSLAEKHHGKSSYVLEPIWDKLLNVWQSSMENTLPDNTLSSENLKKVYSSFESELGRYLSPMENEKIVHWCSSDGFSGDIILEALKRAVLQGKLSFSYVDSILRTWAGLQLKTIKEINTYEKQFKEKKVKNTSLTQKPKQKPYDKYSKIYVT